MRGRNRTGIPGERKNALPCRATARKLDCKAATAGELHSARPDQPVWDRCEAAAPSEASDLELKVGLVMVGRMASPHTAKRLISVMWCRYLPRLNRLPRDVVELQQGVFCGDPDRPFQPRCEEPRRHSEMPRCCLHGRYRIPAGVSSTRSHSARSHLLGQACAQACASPHFASRAFALAKA